MFQHMLPFFLLYLCLHAALAADQTFVATGSVQNYQLAKSGIYLAKLWGAGGGSAAKGDDQMWGLPGGDGGNGSFVTVYFVGKTGDMLGLWVGSGGQGGKIYSNFNGGGGGGGGMSALFQNGVVVAIAGGGGGGGGGDGGGGGGDGSNMGEVDGGVLYMKPNGGNAGEKGKGEFPGFPGSMTAGGPSVGCTLEAECTAGGYFLLGPNSSVGGIGGRAASASAKGGWGGGGEGGGSDAYTGGGGGGGGLYGGGGGADALCTQCSLACASGGGGGSSYLSPAAAGIIMSNNASVNDVDYVHGVGAGGIASLIPPNSSLISNSGGNGYITLTLTALSSLYQETAARNDTTIVVSTVGSTTISSASSLSSSTTVNRNGAWGGTSNDNNNNNNDPFPSPTTTSSSSSSSNNAVSSSFHHFSLSISPEKTVIAVNIVSVGALLLMGLSSIIEGSFHIYTGVGALVDQLQFSAAWVDCYDAVNIPPSLYTFAQTTSAFNMDFTEVSNPVQQQRSNSKRNDLRDNTDSNTGTDDGDFWSLKTQAMLQQFCFPVAFMCVPSVLRVLLLWISFVSSRNRLPSTIIRPSLSLPSSANPPLRSRWYQYLTKILVFPRLELIIFKFVFLGLLQACTSAVVSSFPLLLAFGSIGSAILILALLFMIFYVYKHLIVLKSIVFVPNADAISSSIPNSKVGTWMDAEDKDELHRYGPIFGHIRGSCVFFFLMEYLRRIVLGVHMPSNFLTLHLSIIVAFFTIETLIVAVLRPQMSRWSLVTSLAASFQRLVVVIVLLYGQIDTQANDYNVFSIAFGLTFGWICLEIGFVVFNIVWGLRSRSSLARICPKSPDLEQQQPQQQQAHRHQHPSPPSWKMFDAIGNSCKSDSGLEGYGAAGAAAMIDGHDSDGEWDRVVPSGLLTNSDKQQRRSKEQGADTHNYDVMLHYLPKYSTKPKQQPTSNDPDIPESSLWNTVSHPSMDVRLHQNNLPSDDLEINPVLIQHNNNSNNSISSPEENTSSLTPSSSFTNTNTSTDHAAPSLEEAVRCAFGPTSDNHHASKVLKHLCVTRLVGSGVSGKVFLAKWNPTGQVCALKVARITQATLDTATIEARVLQHLTHPFVASMFASFFTPNLMFLVMQFQPGGSLGDLIKSREDIPIEWVKRYICEIIVALEFIHGHKVIHRDLKPDNILIGSAGHICITDFGLAAENIDDDHKCEFHSGTPSYSAPEVIRGKPHGYEVDWWALGCVWFELLAGQRPFHHISVKNTLVMIATANPNFSLLRIDTPFDDLHAIRCLLHKNPMRRLGKGGAKEVQGYAAFKRVDWKKLMTSDGPFVPEPVSVSSEDCCDLITNETQL